MGIFLKFTTILMAIVGVAMVVGAWFSIGHMAGEAVVDLAMLGILLPAAMFALATIIGWQQRVAAGAPLGGFAAWCTGHQVNKLVPVVVVGLIFGMANNLNKALDRPAPHHAASEATDEMDATTFDREMRKGCFSSGVRTLHASGNDQTSIKMRTKVENYCGCTATKLEAAYPLAELTRLTLDDAPGLKDAKYTGIMKACASASFQ